MEITFAKNDRATHIRRESIGVISALISPKTLKKWLPDRHGIYCEQLDTTLYIDTTVVYKSFRATKATFKLRIRKKVSSWVNRALSCMYVCMYFMCMLV